MSDEEKRKRRAAEEDEERDEEESEDESEDESDEDESTDEESEDEESEEESEDEESEDEDESVGASPTEVEKHEPRDVGGDDHHGAGDHHADDEGPEPAPERDTPKMKLITTAFVVIAAAVVVIVIGTKEYYTAVFDKEYHEKVEVPVSPLRTDLYKKEDEHLSKYQWVDEKKGVARIPADKAKELVLARYKAIPINTEAPAPPPPPKPTEPPPPPPRPERELPGGARIHFDPGSTQEQLVKYIEDKEAKSDKETWFNFDKVTFETGKSTLSPDSDEQLKDIAAILNAYPDLELKIGGYTDNSGDAAANKKLSAERAEAVVKALVGLGIKKERLKSEGYGPEHPIAPNDTEENKAKNRRLALRVTKKPKLDGEKKDDEKKDEKKDPGQAPNPTPQPANPTPANPTPTAPQMTPQPKPTTPAQPQPKPTSTDVYPSGI